MEPVTPPTLRSKISGGLVRGGTHWLLIGSLVGGVAAYLFQVVGARALGEEAYAPIGTLWTIQYLFWSVFLYAMETYVNREVVLGRLGATMRVGAILRMAVWLGAVALALTATTWVLRDALFYGVDDLAVVAGLIVVSYGAFAVVRGRFAGAGRFKVYGLVTAAESVIRLALAVAVVLVAATTRALAWSMPLGALTAAGLWFLVRHRGGPDVDQPSEEPPRTGRFLVLTTVTNAGVQVLLAGAPLVVVALGAGPSEVSVVFVTVTAARVPVVLALGGMLSRMLPTFVRILDERGDAAGAGLADRIALATVALGGLAAAAGGLAGAPLIALFFGGGFAPPWWFAAATGGGVVLATGGMLLNQLLVARGLEHRLPVPWYAGLAAGAIAVVVTGGDAILRVGTGFIVGEVAAIAALTVAARLPRTRREAR